MENDNITSHRASDTKVHCQNCSLKLQCLPKRLNEEKTKLFDAIVRRPQQFPKKSVIAREGNLLTSLFVVRTGSLKQAGSLLDGEQLTRFFMPGDLVGLDGIDELRYPGSVIALEPSTICEIPYKNFEELASQLPELREQLFHSMSKALREDRRMLGILLHQAADERLATLFCEISNYFFRRGYSAYGFRISKSRADIGSYLGIATETVSRALGQFQLQGLLAVRGREIQILDLPALRALARGERYSGYTKKTEPKFQILAFPRRRTKLKLVSFRPPPSNDS